MAHGSDFKKIDKTKDEIEKQKDIIDEKLNDARMKLDKKIKNTKRKNKKE